MSSDTRHKLGRWGENLAADFLESQGYHILCRNWRVSIGEIDIVIQKDDIIAFVEVKTRRSVQYGPPEVAITEEKAQRLLDLGQAYMFQEDVPDLDWRIDLVAIELDINGRLLRCEHIPNIVIGW